MYSVPEQAESVPLGEFTRTQNDTLRAYEEEGIQLIGNNRMFIATSQYLLRGGRGVINKIQYKHNTILDID